MFGLTISAFFHAFYTNGATHEVNGRRPQVGDFFTLPNAGQAFGAAAIVGVALALGYTVCILPVIAVLFLAQFTLFFVVDGGLDAVSAVKASANLAVNNFGQAAVVLLVVGALALAGYLTCGLGMFIALPLATLIEGFAYRTLTNRELAPVSPPQRQY